MAKKYILVEEGQAQTPGKRYEIIPEKQYGRGGSALLGVRSGVTWDGYDEAEGIRQADLQKQKQVAKNAGLPEWSVDAVDLAQRTNPFTPVASGIFNFARGVAAENPTADASNLSGLPFVGPVLGGLKAIGQEQNKDPEYMQTYTDTRDVIREQNRQASEDNPWSYGAGAILGGIASGPPVATAGRLAGEAGKITLKSAIPQLIKTSAGMGLEGAAYGAGYGFAAGEGDISQRGESAKMGAAIGAPLGAVAGPALAYVGAPVAKGIWYHTTTSAENKALDAILKRAQQSGTDLKDVAKEFERLASTGQVSETLAELMGPAERELLQGAITANNLTREQARELFKARGREFVNFLERKMAESMGQDPKKFKQTQAELSKARAEDPEPFYQQAHYDEEGMLKPMQGKDQGDLDQILVDNTEAEGILGSAMQDLNLTGNYAARDEIKNYMEALARIRKGERVRLPPLSVQAADYIERAVNRIYRASRGSSPTGFSGSSRGWKIYRDQIRSIIDDTGVGEARAKAAELINASDAMEEGRKFLNPSVDEEDVAAVMAANPDLDRPAATDLVRRAYAAGATRAMSGALRNTSDMGGFANAARALGKTPAVRAKVQAVRPKELIKDAEILDIERRLREGIPLTKKQQARWDKYGEQYAEHQGRAQTRANANFDEAVGRVSDMAQFGVDMVGNSPTAFRQSAVVNTSAEDTLRAAIGDAFADLLEAGPGQASAAVKRKAFQGVRNYLNRPGAYNPEINAAMAKVLLAQGDQIPVQIRRLLERGVKTGKIRLPAARVNTEQAFDLKRPNGFNDELERGSQPFYDKRLTDNHNKVVEMARNGFSNEEIVEETGLKMGSVKSFLSKARAMGISVPKARNAPPATAQTRLYPRFEKGQSDQQIAEIMNMNPRTVASHRVRFNKARVKRGEPPISSIAWKNEPGQSGGNGVHDAIMGDFMPGRKPGFTGGPLDQMRRDLGNNQPPKPGFAGEKSRDPAVRERIEKAKEMARNGEPKEKIWNELAVMRGADGEWRAEYSDKDARIPEEILQRLRNGETFQDVRLQDVLDHPELYKNYPDLADMETSIQAIPDGQVNAGYAVAYPNNERVMGPSGEFIYAQAGLDHPTSDMRRALLHEIQHAIQNREGFTGGSNRDKAEAIAWQRYNQRSDELLQQIRARQAEIGLKTSPENPNPPTDDEALNALYMRMAALRHLLSGEELYKIYRSEPGEIEANNVMARADMSDFERQMILPEDTQDYPIDPARAERRYSWYSNPEQANDPRFNPWRKDLQNGSGGTGKGTSQLSQERAIQDPGGMGAGREGVRPQAPEVQPLKGSPSEVTIPGVGKVAIEPFAPAHQAAAEYMASKGMQYTPIRQFKRADPKRGARIAKAFDEMPHAPNDPEVRRAYDAMVNETIDQWKAIEKTGLKVDFIEPGMEDPYAASPRLAIEDVKRNNHLWVYPTDSGYGQGAFTAEEIAQNPLLRETGIMISGRKARANDIFRIVHDYFGHIKHGNGFRASGEETAWRAHSMMYSPEARRAMTTETRGQNSWLNFGPHGKANRTANTENTVFADQKIGLLPDWVMREGLADDVVNIDQSFPPPDDFPKGKGPKRGQPLIRKTLGEMVTEGLGSKKALPKPKKPPADPVAKPFPGAASGPRKNDTRKTLGDLIIQGNQGKPPSRGLGALIGDKTPRQRKPIDQWTDDDVRDFIGPRPGLTPLDEGKIPTDFDTIYRDTPSGGMGREQGQDSVAPLIIGILGGSLGVAGVAGAVASYLMGGNKSAVQGPPELVSARQAAAKVAMQELQRNPEGYEFKAALTRVKQLDDEIMRAQTGQPGPLPPSVKPGMPPNWPTQPGYEPFEQAIQR